MKNLMTLFLCFITAIGFGQVQSVDYLMKFNCETNQYDVSLIILEGSATTIPQRAQFNAQISIVVPTGEGIVITNKYMPLQSNQDYNGSAPLDWALGTPIYTPAAQPENDFYSVVPKLSPASFYNDLEEGDQVMLFSFTAGTTGQYNDKIRFFRNGIDPDDNAPGMGGGDFSNGFSLGGSLQIYNGNVEESCLTDINEEISIAANVYPNPFENQFSVELPVDVKSIKVIGSEGKVYYQSANKSKGILMINAYDFPSGVYYLRIETENDITSRKLIKF